MFEASACLILVAGPPLPGRSEFARALAMRRMASCLTWRSAAPAPEDEARAALAAGRDVVLEGEFTLRADREAALRLSPPRATYVVEWVCCRAEAEREAFHRYAGRPRWVEDACLRGWEDDEAEREPVDEDEVPGSQRVTVSSAASLRDQLLAIEGLLPPREAGSAPARARALVVDDDDDTRASLRMVLEELGLSVEEAAGGEEALARLEGEPFDLMLLDQRMPGLSGLEVLAALRARAQAPPQTVLLTAYGDDPSCGDALREGARNVLAKPIRVVDLARVLADCVGSP